MVANKSRSAAAFDYLLNVQNAHLQVQQQGACLLMKTMKDCDTKQYSLHTIGTYGVRNVKASKPWHIIVIMTPVSNQKTLRPYRSIKNPQTGDATADMKYTRLHKANTECYS